MPQGGALRCTDAFDTIQDARPGENLLVVDPKLIREKSRRKFIIRLSEYLVSCCGLVRSRMFQDIVKEKCTIYPHVFPFVILHPREYVVQLIKQFAPMRSVER